MIKKIWFTSALCFLTGCAAGPDYQSPSLHISDIWFSAETQMTEQLTSQITEQKVVHTKWWENFNDQLLNKYIKQALANNKDINIALANLRSARASGREQASSFWPSITAGGSAGRSKKITSTSTRTNSTSNTYNANFDASWEIDIFGGNRRADQAADARIGVSQAEYHDVMLSTFSEVARTYYEARSLQKRIVNTKKNIQLLNKTLEIVQDRLNIGETSKFDLSLAQSEYQLTRARIPNLHAELKASVYSLSVLLGLPPEALLQEMERIQPLPTPPDMVPVGLRSDILRRRPDIRMAERELAAAIADLGSETASLFPKFFLTGNIGSQATLFGDLFSAGTGLWSLALATQWTVFEGGAINARIEQREAESQAALLRYEKTVLEALRDAETALMAYGQELATRARLAQGVASLKKAKILTRALYSAGEQDYLTLIDTERQLVASEDNLIISETNSITKLITLYTALGGGWEIEN